MKKESVVMIDSLNTTIDQSNNSWQNDYLKQALLDDVVFVLFVKKDGTERRMTCTLKPDLLPAQTDLEEAVQKKTPNPDVLAVWDLENQGWRSFRYDSVIGFTKES
jgi:hypothetical protein